MQKEVLGIKMKNLRIAKAQDIIPVVPGPSSRIAKYRLMQLKKTKHQNLSKKNNIA